MRKLIEFFIGRSLLVNVITIGIILVGSMSAYLQKKDMFPEVDFDLIMINSLYPGSTAEDVEKLVTISIERELGSVDGIEEMNAMSFEGRSLIMLKIDPDEDLREVEDDVKSAVDQAQDLPEDVEPPMVTKMEHRHKEFIKIAISGADHLVLRKTAKLLRDRLEELTGVAKVTFGGDGIEEIQINLDPKMLILNEITMGEIANAVRGRNLSLSGGKIITQEEEITIRTVGDFESLKDIENVVVRSNEGGQKIRIKDLAKVQRKINEDSVLQRSNGERAVFLQVQKRYRADILRTTEQVMRVTENFFKRHPMKNLKYKYTDDTSFYVKRRLGILVNNGVLGFALVIGCLLCFLNFRTAIITSLGAPLAFMVSFFVMYSMGFSLNLISMFGLILVLGMLVDDSIIVSEQFYQKFETGQDPRSAALDAAIETIKPVTATILTTMVAFGSIFFMGGIMGKFLWQVPAVVMICLAASWFECFFILPSHLADFVKPGKKGIREGRWYDSLRKKYIKNLSFLTDHYIITIVAFLIIFIFSLFLATRMDVELFPGDDVRVLSLNYKGKISDTRKKTDENLKTIEDIIFKKVAKEELDQVRTMVGQLISMQGGNRSGSHYGTVFVYLTPPTARERGTDEIVSNLENAFQKEDFAKNISIKKMQGGPPKGREVDIEITGEKLSEILVIAKKVKSDLEDIDGVLKPELDYEEGKKQIIIDVNEAEAKRLGVSTSDVALEVRRAFSGDPISEVRESQEDIDVILQFRKEERNDLKALNNIFVLNKVGQRISLNKVVSFKPNPGAFVIRRKDRKRVISVMASLDKKKINPLKVVKLMEPKLKKLRANKQNFQYKFGGENKDTKDSIIRLLNAAAIAFLCIFVILVAMFGSMGQSLIIMSSIPFGIMGVIFTFFLFGKPIGFMAGMGVIGLVGVVVNDSIVLVNFINLSRQSGQAIKEAVLSAAYSRFRPVILTTFTTVAGLLPIAHAPDGDPFLKPMALSFAYGLLLSTVITLVFIPCAYVLYEIILKKLGFSSINNNGDSDMVDASSPQEST